MDESTRSSRARAATSCSEPRSCGVLRPHGLIIRTGDRLVPDEASLTSTVWMAGVFHSLATQGHVSINRFLSTTHGYLGLFRSHGQRVFVELEDGWHLLDVPSAFEMTPSGARWIYQHAGGRIQARSWAPVDRHELWLSLEVLAGPPCRFLVSHHVAVNGDDGVDALPVETTSDGEGLAVRLAPDSDLGRRFPDGSFRIDPGPGTRIARWGGDELLFEDGRSRSQPFLVLVTESATSATLRITGGLLAAGAAPFAPADPAFDDRRGRWILAVDDRELELEPVAGRPPAGDVSRLGEIVPWFTHDALIHHLAPRGLEQYSGGGWGTRDVCQGPAELLLSLGRFEPVRDLLLRLYRNQNPDGDWPQWFMFFERERSIRPEESHGDIVFWPVLALARYLTASEDAGLLDKRIPFFDARGEDARRAGELWGHVERALAAIAQRVVAGTRLAAYGHGDWNDSLQPADPSMRERLCSAWTVTLQYQTLTALAAALRRVGRAGPCAALDESANGVRDDFQRLLVGDGVLPGFAYFHPDGSMERWLHPSDASTGIRYRLLPMIHAILADLLSPSRRAAHVALIREHLLGPDGARLFDRPPRYQGGLQQRFQRAESSSFFGREIGIMYTHAHEGNLVKDLKEDFQVLEDGKARRSARSRRWTFRSARRSSVVYGHAFRAGRQDERYAVRRAGLRNGGGRSPHELRSDAARQSGGAAVRRTSAGRQRSHGGDSHLRTDRWRPGVHEQTAAAGGDRQDARPQVEHRPRSTEQTVPYRTRDMRQTGDPLNDPEDSERAFNARNTLITLRNVADWFASVRGRRKAILFVSEDRSTSTI